MTPTIHWLRDEIGNLVFYKNNNDLNSRERAGVDDEIVVLKAIVRIKTKTIVAVPVAREMINDPAAGDSTLGQFNDEAIYAAELREREIGTLAEIAWRTHYPKNHKIEGGHILKVIDAGPADHLVDDFDPPFVIFRTDEKNPSGVPSK